MDNQLKEQFGHYFLIGQFEISTGKQQNRFRTLYRLNNFVNFL